MLVYDQLGKELLRGVPLVGNQQGNQQVIPGRAGKLPVQERLVLAQEEQLLWDQ